MPAPSSQGPGPRLITIVSTIDEPWGGSEELWSRSIPLLQAQGYPVLVVKRKIQRDHPRFRELAAQGVMLGDLEPTQNRHPMHQAARRTRRTAVGRFVTAALPGPVKQALRHRYARAMRALVDGEPARLSWQELFRRSLTTHRPHLVIVSQGINFDGLPYAHLCVALKVPYVIICNKAVDFFWPPRADRPYMTVALRTARRCLFVSEHNRRLTEEQFGLRLANAQVIVNPVKIAREPLPYPSTHAGYRLACVGRLFLLDKGQDILLRILARSPWTERPVSVSFVGSGVDDDGLRALARLLRVRHVTFTGHKEDILAVWRDHHALVLPSRSEGLPLSIIEAMAAGRPTIVTRAGGNAEVVQDGVTGFIGQATEESFADALERAWQSRDRWEQMGRAACQYVADHIPTSPEHDFSQLIVECVNGS